MGGTVDQSPSNRRIKTRTKVLIGLGVVLAGAGVYAMASAERATLTPSEVRGTVELGVFRLLPSGAKALTCDLRAAKSSGDVRLILDQLFRVVQESGAQEVDIVRTGLVRSQMTVDEFGSEMRRQVRVAVELTPLLWGQVEERIAAMLSTMPSCDAPIEQWEAMFGCSAMHAPAPPSAPLTLGQALGRTA